jgi:glycine cleavage system H protein
MTDPAQTRCGKVVSLRFKKVGRRVERGQSLVTIESAKWVGPFPAVISGEIVANNEAGFRSDMLAANKDPYGAGWLVKIRPSDVEAERAALVTGEQALIRYRARIAENKINCMYQPPRRGCLEKAGRVTHLGCQRLLAKDMLAGLQRRYRDCRLFRRRNCNRDRVDGPILHDRPPVAIRPCD